MLQNHTAHDPWICLFPFMLWRSVQVVICINSLFPSIAEWYSRVWMYQNLFNYVLTVGYFGGYKLQVAQDSPNQASIVHEPWTSYQVGFRKDRRTRDQIANIHWIIEKVREYQKNIYFCLIMPKPLTVFSSVVSDSLQPHGLQHARLPCPSPTPGVYSNLCPLSRWCHPTIWSSVIPFSCPQSFPASGSFQMSQLFASGGQSIGVSASTSVLPMNTQDWSPLGWTGWISLQSKGLSRVFSNTTVLKHQFFGAQVSL